MGSADDGRTGSELKAGVPELSRRTTAGAAAQARLVKRHRFRHRWRGRRDERTQPAEVSGMDQRQADGAERARAREIIEHHAPIEIEGRRR